MNRFLPVFDPTNPPSLVTQSPVTTHMGFPEHMGVFQDGGDFYIRKRTLVDFEFHLGHEYGAIQQDIQLALFLPTRMGSGQ